MPGEAELDAAIEDPWDSGKSIGRTVYWRRPGADQRVIGLMDTPALAAEVVAAHNAKLAAAELDMDLLIAGISYDGEFYSVPEAKWDALVCELSRLRAVVAGGATVRACAEAQDQAGVLDRANLLLQARVRELEELNRGLEHRLAEAERG